MSLSLTKPSIQIHNEQILIRGGIFVGTLLSCLLADLNIFLFRAVLFIFGCVHTEVLVTGAFNVEVSLLNYRLCVCGVLNNKYNQISLKLG